MCLLNIDELQIVAKFLSLEDKVKLSLSCKDYQTVVTKQQYALCCIEKQVDNFFSLVIKSGEELILAVNNNFIMYVDESSIYRIFRSRPLSRKQDNNPECINSNCKSKRLGKIYISLHRGSIPYYLRTIYYIERKMPYCINCFNKWGVDAYLHHPQSKFLSMKSLM